MYIDFGSKGCYLLSISLLELRNLVKFLVNNFFWSLDRFFLYISMQQETYG